MKTFTILPDEDYHQLGFKAGLEIHYQLKTDKKLFCRCPAVKRNDPPDAVIKRHMRPTLSELGEYDGTALMEFKTKKNVYYQLHRDTVCTYEMDDTPPFPLNQQALDIALECAMLLHCAVIDEIHITRKQYLDGSIPTGFQRTATIGVEGYIELYSGKKVGISHICLEEDACREMSDSGHDVVFRTDRLSFPLIEVITLPELLTPREVAEAAQRISSVLRATGKVRRGIGSVRQGVNVSVAGSTRIEIKGVPRIPMIPYWVHAEAVRQKSLLKIRDELRARGIAKDKVRVKMKGINQALTRRSPSCEKPSTRAWICAASVFTVLGDFSTARSSRASPWNASWRGACASSRASTGSPSFSTPTMWNASDSRLPILRGCGTPLISNRPMW